MTIHGLARELVAGTNVGHLATVLPDGAPHSVPLWVDWEGDHLLFLTGPDSRKARNVAIDPRVALSVLDAATPLRSAWLRGRVTRVVDGEAGWALVDRLSTKYTGGPYPREAGARQAYLVEVTGSGGMDFGAA
ncbi:PPOX class F420-dependent oxidoreductase [Myceligenerans pegani]|uniref:PPOX class F420-dependent oxidoreductase n=1 Tax=Myceligenerans pegani TaxID=2776917 RepID=A0ABR9MTF3_9MICO|nr:PPOX class F420-dependent oxidoreductase [Myceligenerans sp. TRM 65318]MBE1874662.1 PPOX class F420-dependent oxidoreductase [Myceligenerans sp. TRM 65318]MBE3016933.1 PPOX class F420-dependent oxidoreductase [Myceligenerans sp. TRM 65318]